MPNPATALAGSIALLALTLAAPAAAVTDLWALQKSGDESAALKGFPSKIRIFSVAEHEKLNEGLKRQHTLKVTFCDQAFMITTAQRRWIATHEKAGHRIVLREREKNGKHRNVC
jgi:hypothetical protein